MVLPLQGVLALTLFLNCQSVPLTQFKGFIFEIQKELKDAPFDVIALALKCLVAVIEECQEAEYFHKVMSPASQKLVEFKVRSLLEMDEEELRSSLLVNPDTFYLDFIGSIFSEFEAAEMEESHNQLLKMLRSGPRVAPHYRSVFRNILARFANGLTDVDLNIVFAYPIANTPEM